MNLEALEEAMKGGAAFFYTIPEFRESFQHHHEPGKEKGGFTSWAVKYQIPVLEDNPYGYLRFSGNEYIPPIQKL